MDVYRLAHEYQIPTVLQRARSIVLQHILSITLIGFCSNTDIKEFLEKHFEILKFGETYQESQISLRAAERLSTLPMKQVAAHPNYKALNDTSKMQIMQYRLKRSDQVKRYNETLDLDFMF